MRSWSQSETTRLISLVIVADVFWPPSFEESWVLVFGLRVRASHH